MNRLRLTKGVSITVFWQEWPVGSTTDTVTGAKLGTPDKKSEVIKGFFYEVSAATVPRRFAEIEQGDAILDLSPDFSMVGKDQIRFLIRDQLWEPKQTGDELTAIWDAVVADVPTAKTILVKRAT